jgi:hypothetical protein
MDQVAFRIVPLHGIAPLHKVASCMRKLEPLNMYSRAGVRGRGAKYAPSSGKFMDIS